MPHLFTFHRYTSNAVPAVRKFLAITSCNSVSLRIGLSSSCLVILNPRNGSLVNQPFFRQISTIFLKIREVLHCTIVVAIPDGFQPKDVAINKFIIELADIYVICFVLPLNKTLGMIKGSLSVWLKISI